MPNKCRAYQDRCDTISCSQGRWNRRSAQMLSLECRPVGHSFTKRNVQAIFENAHRRWHPARGRSYRAYLISCRGLAGCLMSSTNLLENMRFENLKGRLSHIAQQFLHDFRAENSAMQWLVETLTNPFERFSQIYDRICWKMRRISARFDFTANTNKLLSNQECRLNEGADRNSWSLASHPSRVQWNARQ